MSSRRLLQRRTILGAGLAGLALGLPTTLYGQRRAVDMALVLAADCSGSVHGEHYTLQQRGYGDAFRDPKVIKAIRSGIHGAIAACYFQWSGYRLQTQQIPWTILQTDAEIAAFALALERTERVIFSGGTSPAGAIEFGQALLARTEVEVARRVIDVSGDGRSNNGPVPDAVRDRAVAAGIVINGLPILHLEPDIDDYYRDHVIGGPGAFMIPARDFEDFAAAIRRKLVLEIAGVGAVLPS
ncbi:MAG: DUF1194 domain-containing protein [Ferrovibrio sp.]|uniref:DUF1194 domain-containing protein n=1 Tax=Ferrovibrio sp. TaxID=1917215 RepID=UPI00391AA492